MTDLDTYQPATGIGQYQAGIVMTPEAAKALDEQVRLCTKAVLREGVDYGHIPGTSGEEKSLWRPGAQKLLQWFGLGCTVDRVEVERDEDGRKHGITYRATVTRRLPDGTPWILATCEGTADYDESKFYQSAEEVQRKAQDRERAWAAKDGRPARPTKWQGLGEYRADWNALMKRAQKRAIVGAVVDATAAGGIFTDREEDDGPAPEDGGPSWYEQALETAADFTDRKAGEQLYVQAAQAYRDGLCTGRQKDHIQNRVRQRLERIKGRRVTDVEDLARAAQAPAAEDDTTSGSRHAAAVKDRAQPPPPQDTPASDEGAKEEVPAEDQPGSASEDQLQALHVILGGLGFGEKDRDAKLRLAETIAGRELAGPHRGRSSKNLSWTEARKLTHTLDGFGGDREKLIAFMAGREQGGDGDA